MDRVNDKQYILDGIADESEEEWLYLKWDFQKFFNLLFRVNGDNFGDGDYTCNRKDSYDYKYQL